MQCLKDRYVISHLCEISRTGKACRAGTDHCNLFSLLLRSALGLNAIFSRPVSHKTLQLTDGNGITLDAADTLSFALALLRAHTSADCGKCACLADDLISLFNIAFLYFMNECRDVDRNGTTLDTLCILTIDTSGSLALRLFHVIAKTNLFEVCCPHLCILFPYRNLCHNVHLLFTYILSRVID